MRTAPVAVATARCSLTACLHTVRDDGRSAEIARLRREALKAGCLTRHLAGDCDSLSDELSSLGPSDPASRAASCEAQAHGCELGGFFSCGRVAHRRAILR